MARTASRPTYVRRFSRTERGLHWIHASAFFALLVTGLLLYVPYLGEQIGRRPQVKEVHLLVSLAWAIALVAVVIVGDRRGLRRTLSELDAFDGDDRRWLRGGRAPQGRFNAGQKLNAVFTAAFALLFAVSGTLLWLGERNTSFRFDGTIFLHDGLTLFSVFLLTGHLYLALIHPSTRHALRGVTRGDVRVDWAREHHAKWIDETDQPRA